MEFDLARLLGPDGLENFFRDWWEKRPLAVSRNDANFYSGLFSRSDLDRVIAFTRPRFIDPDHLRPRNFVQGWHPEDETFDGYYPDLPAMHRSYSEGKTVIIKALHKRWPAVATLCRSLEATFGCPVHTNLNLTPPRAQGFAAHFDTHEVFVLQIEGDKHWRLFGAAREWPLESEEATIPEGRLGSPTQEVLLQPGDLLYIPRGHVHEAFTSELASLHLTIGVNVFRWLDVLKQALTDAGTADVRFRQSLPLGLLCNERKPDLNGQFQELLHALVQKARFEDAVAAMSEDFVDKLSPLPQDDFTAVDPGSIELDTVVERIAGPIVRVIRKGDTVTLRAPGVRIDGPAKIARALDFIAATPRFTPRELPDNLTHEAKLVLVRRLIREKLLTGAERPRSAADLERFLRLAEQNPAIAEGFWGLKDKPEFIERVVRRGETLGCWFAAEHVEEAMRAGWQVWLARADR